MDDTTLPPADETVTPAEAEATATETGGDNTGDGVGSINNQFPH